MIGKLINRQGGKETRGESRHLKLPFLCKSGPESGKLSIGSQCAEREYDEYDFLIFLLYETCLMKLNQRPSHVSDSVAAAVNKKRLVGEMSNCPSI